MTSKPELRKIFNGKRAAMTPAYKAEAAKAAARIFASLPVFKKSEHIACYLSYKDEFDSSPLIETIWQAKKHCYLPVLQESKENQALSLCFVRYKYGDPLRLNRFSILEPVNVSSVIPPEALHLVITPLVAFDRLGHRLGTGGGYYDRTFGFLQSASLANKPELIGLGYAEQEAEDIPASSWDVLLDGVVTEKEFVLCNPVA